MILKSETFIYFRFITCKVKHFCFNFDDYNSQLMKVKNQYLKIFKYFLRSIKKRTCKTEKFKFFKVYSFMHSVLGRSSFSTSSRISEVWHVSNQPVALLSNAAACFTAFSSSVLLDPQFIIFLLKISHRFQIGFRSGMLSGQSSTVI